LLSRITQGSKSSSTARSPIRRSGSRNSVSLEAIVKGSGAVSSGAMEPMRTSTPASRSRRMRVAMFCQ
jgi:hypothetical protein